MLAATARLGLGRKGLVDVLLLVFHESVAHLIETARDPVDVGVDEEPGKGTKE